LVVFDTAPAVSLAATTAFTPLLRGFLFLFVSGVFAKVRNLTAAAFRKRLANCRSMSTTTEDAAALRGYVKALNKAIARGARSVTLGGQTITYNTTESLMKARNDMQAQLAAAERAASSQKVSRQNYAVYGGRDF